MRISKVVREYIEGEVAKKYPKSWAQVKYKELQDNLQAINDFARERYDAFRTALMAEVEERFGVDTTNLDFGNVSIYISRRPGSIADLANKDRSESVKKISDKVNEIIVTCELGGTKEDLDRMLNNCFADTDGAED